MVIAAILFDVGGPIDTEELSEPVKDACLQQAAAEHGVPANAMLYAAANGYAVDAFASNTYAAIVWKLCAGNADTARRVFARFRELAAQHRAGELFTLRPGIAALLADLRQRGLLLGLAANQPASVLSHLERHGIAGLFRHTEVSGHHGFHKPDPRLFTRACDDLGVAPDACIMVGDRVDNDIVPARLLRMRTVLFRTGRHAGQQPRSWDEMPDAEVATVEELGKAIATLL